MYVSVQVVCSPFVYFYTIYNKQATLHVDIKLTNKYLILNMFQATK